MFKYILKRINAELYNIKNHTKIASLQASLRAQYGRDVRIGKGTIVEKTVSIGDYSYVNINSSVENCDIGKYCSISTGVFINPAEHNVHSRSTYPLFSGAESQKRVKIGNDVLISLNAIILRGVEIGDGAVIGAGAVVTKDVQPYEIVGGVPAHHIGWREIPPKIEIDNTVYNWWDFEIDVVKKNEEYFLGKTDEFYLDGNIRSFKNDKSESR